MLAQPIREVSSNLTDYVLGYTVGNDVSARDAAPAPMGGLDLFSVKTLTGTTPVGPWITTKDEFGRSAEVDVTISLRVNNEQRQRDRTGKMIFGIEECLEYIVARMSLTPGDIVFTGTTDGVGFEDGRYLQAGDVVEAEVEGVGVLRNVVGAKQSLTR